MIRLRPRLAIGICLALWALSAYLIIDALIGIGVRALPFTIPVLLLSACAWAVLWHPQVIIDDARRAVTVRNVLSTWHLPHGSILAVSLGAMVTLRVRAEQNTERTVTAWNAPGVSPLARGIRQGLGDVVDPSARSESAALERAWRRWGADDGDGPAGKLSKQADGYPVARRTWNVVPLGVVLVLLAATIVSFSMMTG